MPPLIRRYLSPHLFLGTPHTCKAKAAFVDQVGLGHLVRRFADWYGQDGKTLKRALKTGTPPAPSPFLELNPPPQVSLTPPPTPLPAFWLPPTPRHLGDPGGSPTLPRVCGGKAPRWPAFLVRRLTFLPSSHSWNQLT